MPHTHPKQLHPKQHSFFRKDTTNKLGKFLQKHFRMRQAVLALLLYLSSLGLAVAFPNSSYKVIRITGAVGVGLVAYVIPVINHFCLYFGISKAQRAPREVIMQEKLVRESLQAAELLDIDLPPTTAVTAPAPDSAFGPKSKDMESGGGPKDSASELANGVSDEDVVKIEKQVGTRRRSFVVAAKERMSLRRRAKATQQVVIPEGIWVGGVFGTSLAGSSCTVNNTINNTIMQMRSCPRTSQTSPLLTTTMLWAVQSIIYTLHSSAILALSAFSRTWCCPWWCFWSVGFAAYGH